MRLLPNIRKILPESRFRIEDRFQRTLGEARLYITRSRSTVTGEDITEQDENGKIKDTEGQLAADENRNETVETEVSQEIHSEYKIPGKSESRVSYHLSGMYQDWFLDYASYVILERAVPHINDGLKPVQRRIYLYPNLLHHPGLCGNCS